MTQPNLDSIVSAYMKLRTQKEEVEREAKEKLDVIKANLAKLESYFLSKMEQDGVSSYKTSHGTVFSVTKDFTNVGDWDAVLTFIKDNSAYDLLERRVNKMAVRAYMEENQAVPPGVNYTTKIDIGVRKPTS